jgi:transcriptional regulator with XRE-family HTH domain
MDRAVTVERFRERLRQVIRQTGLSRTAFAEKVGIDRSTLSQILSRAGDRLPRVETIAAIAASQQVSIDWLMGLSEEGPVQTNIVPALEITHGGSSPSDEMLERWYSDSRGHKIRHVPATLPDVLKTPAVIEYEYRQAAVARPEQRIESSQHGLAYQRRLESDTEICTSVQALEELARGEGVWRGLPLAERRRQLEQFTELVEELYPAYRWFLYDALRRYSVPLTVFGQKRAVIYVGQAYFAFNSREHIRELSRRFDDLIREAVVQPHEIAGVLRRLVAEA